MADIQTILGNNFLRQRSDLFVAAGVIVAVLMFVIPLPAVLLDAFMSLNFVFSLLVILITLYTHRALDFSIFPTLLLIATVFGLALNVSSTRLILSQGAEFEGRLVRAFGTFVVGDEELVGLVIGLIIFTIIIVVQVVVITKGATRVAEVAARFTLDSLPVKQMAIEAEYNAGAVTEEEANKKKEELQREADFYGAMDGAAKFVSGNVKAGIFITVLNIMGGMIVGMTLLGEPFELALQTYVSLTVGDGLVTQFPALLISTATGLIVTRAVGDGAFGTDVSTQFARYPKVYWVATIFLVAVSFLPGFPWYVLLPLAGLTSLLAFHLGKRRLEEERAQERAKEPPREKSEQQPDPSNVAPLDPISLELGYGLVPLVDKDQGAELLERVTRIRRETALDLGLVVPRIRIIDNMRLEPSEYTIKIRGTHVGSGVIRLNHYLCINPGGEREEIPGERTRDPAFGLPALWVTEEYRERAERAGYTVVDAPSIIATHLTEVIKRHAAEILGRQECRTLLDGLKKDYPAVVEEAQANLSLGEIQKVLQGLLKEQVSIRNMVTILETLADYATITKDTAFLIEKVRQALGRQICQQYADDGTLYVLTIEPAFEQRLIDNKMDTPTGPVAALKPEAQRAWITSLTNSVHAVQQQGMLPVVLCSESARPLVRSSTVRDIPDLVVLSVPEIASDVRVESVGEVRVEGAA